MKNTDPITVLPGIGEKTAGLFSKLGVYSVGGLMRFYPAGYELFGRPTDICQLRENAVFAVSGNIETISPVRGSGRFRLVGARLSDGTGRIELVWYNMPYITGVLKKSGRCVFRGKVVKKNGRLCMQQPRVFPAGAYQAMQDRLVPVYHQTKGLGNTAIQKFVKAAFLYAGPQTPKEAGYSRRFGFKNLDDAAYSMHFPESEEDLAASRKALVFGEFLAFLLRIRSIREALKQKEGRKFADLGACRQMIKNLPYELTSAQKRVWQEIEADLSSGHIMNRLLQGDVGSGKTAVAALALIRAAENGSQGVIMVPTEVLARQQYASMTEFIRLSGLETEAVLLCGSMKAREKREALEKIESGKAGVIVGTHALIQTGVKFHDLSLAVIDEQHRFGVRQREFLGQKGDDVHVLVMSATPIPRTLAIILCADLDLSVIDAMPSSRLPVKTCAVGTDYRENAWRFLEKEVEKGHQAYVICPLVEDGELTEAENVTDYTKLLKDRFGGKIPVAMLHGRMDAERKNAVMQDFSDGKIKVLVATTVIEVGIDVPSATVIIIENAERFGLATLHQLRGRVGRGRDQSYCVLISSADDEKSMSRLDVLNRTNNGFEIAGEDLKLRGPGELLGMAQTGDMKFGLADIYRDADILKEAAAAADEILKEDGHLKRQENREILELFGGDEASSFAAL